MPLFQNTVVQKYLKTQDQNALNVKWETYKAHFHNPSIQENLRNAKEEQYQEGFLRDLFVNTLGYILNPETEFNLTTELKNVKDAKKADGGILINDKVVGVIELKGTDTTDLSKVETQAFGYKNNQPDCKYVITSNFEKLRFYIDNAIEHLAFDLFHLTEQEFKLLYLCLAYDNIKKEIPAKLKKESLSQEDVITKQLYKDYSLFKRELFNNLTELNPVIDPLLLFKKSQKLLDRFLFLFFAEDRHLLPPNSVRLILQQWKQLKELDAYTPLFERFKKYFGYLNTGYKGKKYDVYPYNGGLFKPDDILDKIEIDDELLYEHTLKLSEYDFDSEVDVNILGHIFENSLTEIEEIQTQLEEDPNAKPKVSKRKKDGVFYTPKYITKYIVKNTVGKLCEEQKQRFNIVEEDYTFKRQKKTKETLLEKLKTYRQWLLELTICDPACGSGAFLNEALNYLIAEHQYIDELETKLMGGGFVFPNVENSILENNLYGVDINNESIEIAKLSLWLRTAQPNRKLNDLSGNIKCGNSLINDPEVAGDKAFNWQKEFPQVFKEKDKHAFHITTALHDSRTSQRMIDYKVRLKRDGGANPYPNYEKLTAEEEVIIAKETKSIVEEDDLRVLAFNVCGDHIHLLLVCEEEEVPKIMQKIKAKTARAVNIHKGITTPSREHAPLANDDAPSSSSREHAPLNKRGKKQNSLWTQKYGCKPITDETQLHNTINYIESNRSKHELPQSKTLKALIYELCCTEEEAFAPEYKGGFDVVIGNPPYVRSRELFSKNEKDFYLDNYNTASYQLDLYKLFIEKSCYLINSNGKLSFITPSVFLTNDYDRSLRKFILEEFKIESIANSDKDVFDDASVKTVTFVISKFQKHNKIHFYQIKNGEFVYDKKIEQINFIEQDYLINEKLEIGAIPIIKKLSDFEIVGDYFDVKNGIKVRKDLLYAIQSDNNYKPFILGKNVQRFYNSYDKIYIHYTSENEKLFTNQAFRTKDIFEQDKLIIRQILGNRIIACFDDNEFYTDQTTYVISKNSQDHELKPLLCIISSKLIYFYFTKTLSDNKTTFPKVKRSQILKLPYNNKPVDLLSSKADTMFILNKDLQERSDKFQRSLQREFPEELEKLSKKLQDWYELSFADFIKELKKKKIKLSLSQKAEWEDYFLAEQQKALELKAQIDATDQEIDQMVYELYGLTEEEIKIVEES